MSESHFMKAEQLRARSDEIREASKKILSRMDALIVISNILLRKGDRVIKRCSCGVNYVPSQWFKLEVIGYQETDDIDGELRNCACGSTLMFVTRKP